MSIYLDTSRDYVQHALAVGGQPLATMIESALDGSDYGQGAVEDAQATASKCAEYLGRLSLMLVEKKILDMEEIVALLYPAARGFTEGGEHYVWPKNVEG